MADALRELVAKWRKKANEYEFRSHTDADKSRLIWQQVTLDDCADELEAALAAARAEGAREERARIREELDGLTVYPDTATIMPQSMSHVKASTFVQVVRQLLTDRSTP